MLTPSAPHPYYLTSDGIFAVENLAMPDSMNNSTYVRLGLLRHGPFDVQVAQRAHILQDRSFQGVLGLSLAQSISNCRAQGTYGHHE
jgi:hypothetical protein